MVKNRISSFRTQNPRSSSTIMQDWLSLFWSVSSDFTKVTTFLLSYLSGWALTWAALHTFLWASSHLLGFVQLGSIMGSIIFKTTSYLFFFFFRLSSVYIKRSVITLLYKNERHVWNTLHALSDVKEFFANKSAHGFADLLRYINLMLWKWDFQAEIVFR